jgi:molecular chaperone DnaK (HSP70)
MEKVFGIDLGTTYSCIAYVDEYAKPVVVTNEEGDRTTPSVVFFDEDNEVVVGKVAKEQMKVDPTKVVAFIKRDMGNSGFLFNHNGVDYKPEEISAHILQKMVKDASEKLGFDIKDVVITCPAYFGINEKAATKIAGEIAGLNVLAIIPEPTAAAVAFGMDKEENQTVLVYDLGGGTFDITMIKIEQDKIEVVVTGGDHNLGGKNWDDALMSYFASCFEEQTGVSDDIFEDPETFGSMQLSAEDAKKTLSLKNKANTSVIYGTDKAKIETTREKFDEITSDLVQRTIDLTKSMLDDAQRLKSVSSFDKILLVGGSTKMPQVKEALAKEFPDKPIESFDPDESVAKGAAIYGQQLAVNGELIKKIAEQTGKSEEEVKEEMKGGEISEAEVKKAAQKVATETGYSLGSVEKLTAKTTGNVTAKSFGLKVVNQNQEYIIANIIKAQDSIPTEKTNVFSTNTDNQSSVSLEVYENEFAQDVAEISDSEELGKGEIEGLPAGLPAGSPIQVTFRLDESGLLDVEAIDLTQNKKVKFQIEIPGVMNRAEIQAAKQRVSGLSMDFGGNANSSDAVIVSSDENAEDNWGSSGNSEVVSPAENTADDSDDW